MVVAEHRSRPAGDETTTLLRQGGDAGPARSLLRRLAPAT
jgi:hypothetical protein